MAPLIGQYKKCSLPTVLPQRKRKWLTTPLSFEWGFETVRDCGLGTSTLTGQSILGQKNLTSSPN